MSDQLPKMALKNLLAKYSSDQLVETAEAAEILGVSEAYIIKAIRQARLKAFKIDEHWFLEKTWLDQFKRQLQKAAEAELSVVPSRQTWVRHTHQHRQPADPWVKSLRDTSFDFLFLTTAVAAAMIVLGFFAPNFYWLSVHRQRLAINFCEATRAVYALPETLLSAGSRQFKGQVAGAFEGRLK